jgi:hypothetical protein
MEIELALADLFPQNHLNSMRKAICTPNFNSSSAPRFAECYTAIRER